MSNLHRQLEAIARNIEGKWLELARRAKARLMANDNQQSIPEAASRIIEKLQKLSDDEWLNVLIHSIKKPIYRGIELPGFPSKESQEAFVGAADEGALRSAAVFYRIIKRYAVRFHPLTAESKILDFGCGWGRFPRFFLRDVPAANIYGVDVWSRAIELCKQSGAPGHYCLVQNAAPLPFDDNSFDLVFAYSVFSHLSEPAQRRWVEELARVLKPGGLLLATTQGREFIEFCRGFRIGTQPLTSVWHELLARSFVDADAALADYDQGQFLYAANGGGGDPSLNSTVYGDALIPRAYVEREWTKFLSFRDFVDDRGVLEQALIVMQKGQ